MRLSLIFVLAGALELCSAARILFIIPLPARSHYNLGDRLIEELIKKGHEVTILAPFKKPKPLQRLTEIVLPNISEVLFKSFTDTIPQTEEGKFGMRNMNPISFLFFGELGPVIINETMNYKPVQDLMNSKLKFDLVIGECFLVEGLIAGFSYRFKAPIATIATFMPNVWANEMVGNPYPSSYVPDPILGYTDKMNFLQRLTNFLYTTISQANHYLRHLPQQDQMMRKHFGKDMPYIKEILAKTSLVLVNHHYSLAFPRPYLPNMIEIGGYHVKPPKPLPQDIQKFIDESKDGVIYFSMGSNLESSEFPKEKIDTLLKVFARLKQRILWKFESGNIDLPKNVKISKWMPQSDILAHPNVKLFISHGGLLSTTESILRGVPILGIPIFGDQPINVKYIVSLEVGIKLDYDDLRNEQKVYSAIEEVLNNPKYENNVKHRSKLLQDLPMSTIDTAIYWLEYVIRHKGAPHLISGAQDLSWFELHNLDVYSFLLFVNFAVVFVLIKFFGCISRTLFGRNKNKKTSASKKKN